MKKIFLSFILCLGFISINCQQIYAANIYTQQQLLDGIGKEFNSGDIINFDNAVKVTFLNLENKQISNQTVSTITLPNYSTSTKSFKGWLVGSEKTSGNQLTEISFVPYMKTPIHFNKVTDGENITITVDKNDIPYADGTYTSEWINGGMAGGVYLEGTQKNTLSLTLTPESPFYKNKQAIVLKISSNSGKKIFSEEAILAISPKELSKPDDKKPESPKDTNTTTPDKKQPIVKTSDSQSLFTYTLLALSSFAIIATQRHKKENKN